MTELSGSLLSGVEKFDRLSREREALLKKLKINKDIFRAIVYQRLIDRLGESIDSLVGSLSNLEAVS